MGTFDHIAFQVSNMDRSIQFYVHKLGFSLVSHAVNAQEQQTYVFLALGDLRVELIQDLNDTTFAAPNIRPPYCPHLAIETDNMQAAVARLREAEVTILHGPLELEGEGTWVYFGDPDNNILEYIQWYRKE